MTIQLPIILWTVICFILLMLILRFLLFKPILEIMDKRKQKIANAKKKQEEIAALTREHEKRLALFEADAKIQRENYIKSERKIIRIKSKTLLEQAKNGRAARLDEQKRLAEEDKEKIKASFGLRSEEIARIFAERLTDSQS